MLKVKYTRDGICDATTEPSKASDQTAHLNLCRALCRSCLLLVYTVCPDLHIRIFSIKLFIPVTSFFMLTFFLENKKKSQTSPGKLGRVGLPKHTYFLSGLRIANYFCNLNEICCYETLFLWQHNIFFNWVYQ